MLGHLTRGVTLAVCILSIGPAAALADQVIPDDLIVQGSSCIGLDCINNESFGFDTIRLKAINTRIKFDDTSNTAGFAANDWQLTANDAISGGANQFSIEDITGSKIPFKLLAGAPTGSILLDALGNLGLGTTTPAQPLHVRRSDGTARLEVQETSATEAPRILADLVNNGAPQLRFSNTATGATSWLAGPDGGGFVIGTAGGAAANALMLSGGGDATSAGALQQGADPAGQEALAAVAPADILAAVTSLPISRFEYVADGSNAKHLAPAGAAFRAALGLGASDKALAPGDVAAAALAGVQAVAPKIDGLGTIVAAVAQQSNAKSRKLSRRVTKLSKANRKLSKRLRALERRVAAG